MGTRREGRSVIQAGPDREGELQVLARRARHAGAVRLTLPTRPRIRLRTALLAIAALASMLAAYRLVRERLVYCRELADFYDASANNAEDLARWEGLGVEYGRSPDPAAIAAIWYDANECRDRAAFYRAVAYRPWLRLPAEPSKKATGQWVLPCPDDITSGPPEASPAERPASAKRKAKGG
jgi:hypothetical protein